MTTTLMQRSPEWYAARCGSLGASDIADALARTKTGWGASRAAVMSRLIIERLIGKPVETFVSMAMQNGIDTEGEARAAYAFRFDCDVAECGLYRHPTIACTHASPDGLVGDDGLVEIKCPQPPAHLELLLGGATPQRHALQCQWQMAVTGRVWCDLVSYQPTFPAPMQLVVRRIERDDRHIAELEAQVRAFLEETEARFQALLTAYQPERTFAAVRRLTEAAARELERDH